MNNNCNSKCEKCRRVFLIGTGVLGALIILYGITVVVFSHETTTIPVHHLLHAGMSIGSVMLAMVLATLWPVKAKERAWWAIPVVLAPAIGLFLMWPSLYHYLMARPMLHVLDHVGIALCAFVAVFGAQLYARGLGLPIGVMVVAMNAAAAGGFGVAPPSGEEILAQQKNVAQQNAPDQAASSEPVAMHVKGKKLAHNLGCVACHSTDGSKRIGPTWKNLAGYAQKFADGKSVVADYHFLREAILNPNNIHLQGYPAGVMPQLLSGPEHADEHDLHAIIWYINTLSDRSDKSTQPPVPDEPPAPTPEASPTATQPQPDAANGSHTQPVPAASKPATP